MPKIIGQLREIEQVAPRSFKRNDGESVDLAGFPRLHVLEGARHVHAVNVDPQKFQGSLPEVGASLDIDVEVRAFNSKSGVQIVFDLLKVNESAAAGRRAAA